MSPTLPPVEHELPDPPDNAPVERAMEWMAGLLSQGRTPVWTPSDVARYHEALRYAYSADNLITRGCRKRLGKARATFEQALRDRALLPDWNAFAAAIPVAVPSVAEVRQLKHTITSMKWIASGGGWTTADVEEIRATHLWFGDSPLRPLDRWSGRYAHARRQLVSTVVEREACTHYRLLGQSIGIDPDEREEIAFAETALRAIERHEEM